ncbi:MAG: NUDIX hydrolase [Phaeodactylibacter sp.]|uniref:NUDIX hydrolase n=1 Tax=Phaeodactylibacter sp. TaxID=1940289 RepID=UPI0032EE1AC6
MQATARPDWERLRAEPGPELKIFNVRFDYMRNPRNKAVERMVVLESPDAANVVARRASDGSILFVEQYRFGIGRYTLELPGGMVDTGEAQEIAARRELLEEAGATAQSWHFLGKIPSNPVFQDSYIFHWLAEDVRLVQQPTLDAGEDVYLQWLPEAEVRERLYSGQFEHPHTVNALLLFFHHLQNS